jgi:hypothetical protein
MRFTVLGQFVKGLAHHEPEEAAALEDRLDRIKWRLWHGDGRESLIRLDTLAEDIDVLKSDYPNLERFAKIAAEFATYIRNNRLDSQLRRALAQWRVDLDFLCRVDGQRSDQQALLQEAADAMDAGRRAPSLADPRSDPRRRPPRHFRKMVPGIGSQ